MYPRGTDQNNSKITISTHPVGQSQVLGSQCLEGLGEMGLPGDSNGSVGGLATQEGTSALVYFFLILVTYLP